MRTNKYTANINVFMIERNFDIHFHNEVYSRTESGKSWKRKPDEVEDSIVSAEFYYNYCNAIPFFKNFGYGASERAEWNYTPAGYLVTKITSVNPGRDKKCVRTFKFVHKEVKADVV